VLIGKYGADRPAGGFVARKYNHAGCMKRNSFRKWGVLLLQRNRALRARHAPAEDHAAIRK
jgi:hypothetical protein